MMSTEECIKYDQMVELGIATAEELNLAKNLLGGSWSVVIDAVCYIRTGYRAFEQYLLEMNNEEEE